MDARRKIPLIALILAFSCSSPTPKKESPRVASQGPVHRFVLETQSRRPASPSTLDDILKQAGLDPEHVGICVISPGEKKPALVLNGNRPFPTASNLKVFTAFTALEVLGPNTRFLTKFIVKGKKNSPGCLKGGGDPLVYSRDLQSLAIQARSQGVKSIQGPLVYDDTLIPRASVISRSMREGLPYNASVGSLNYEHNRFMIHWKQLSSNSEEVVWSYNTTPQVPLTLEASNHEIFDQNEILFAPGSRALFSKNSQAEGDRPLPMPDPARAMALHFRDLLKKSGIEVEDLEPVPGKCSETKQSLVYEHQSPTVLELVDSFLEFSNGVIGQSLVLHMGKKVFPKRATYQPEEVLVVLKRRLEKQYPYLKKASFEWADAAGLSPHNQISPLGACRFLQSIANKAYRQRSFMTLLPQWGVRGTLAGRNKNPALQGLVFAKTGSLSFVSNLLGQAPGPNGPIFFSLMTKQSQMRLSWEKLQNDLERSPATFEAPDFAPELEQKQNEWPKKVQGFQENFLEALVREGVPRYLGKNSPSRN